MVFHENFNSFSFAESSEATKSDHLSSLVTSDYNFFIMLLLRVMSRSDGTGHVTVAPHLSSASPCMNI